MTDSGWEENKFDAPKFITATLDDKWEGEDEDDEVKDNWDDEDPPEEKENEAPPPPVASSQPKKKSLKQLMAEKEEKKRREAEERRRQEEEELTPEELQAEKLRIRQLQEEGDLELAKQAFGVSDSPSSTFESLQLSSKDSYDELQNLLMNKLNSAERSPHYVTFVEELMRAMCVSLDAEEVKKLSSTLGTIANEMMKSQKGKAKKKAGKKVALKQDRGNSYLEDYAAGDDYDFL